MAAQKKKVSMRLRSTPESTSDEQVYKNFKNRVRHKSNHAHFCEGEQPILLRLYLNGSLFNSTVEYLVKHKTFEIISNTNGDEVGFKAIIYSVDFIMYELTVLKDKNKASYKRVPGQKARVVEAKTIHMGLPSVDKDTPIETFYQNFKKRTRIKSNNPYVDKGKDPCLLRLHLDGSNFDSTVEMLVKYKSFELIYANSEENKDEEIGFRAVIYSVDSTAYELTVYRKQGKASYKRIRNKKDK